MFSHSKTHILNVTFSVSVHKKKLPVGQKTNKTSFSKICVFFNSEVISPNTNISRHAFLCIFIDFGQKIQNSSFPLRKMLSRNVSNPENALTQPVNFTQTTPHGEVLRLLYAECEL